MDKNNLRRRRQKKYKNTTKLSMIAEVIVVLLFPYPYYDINIYIPLRYNFHTITTCYKLSDFLYCVMFLRFYLLIRAISNYSMFQNEMARIYIAKYNIRPSLLFSCKCMLLAYP